MRVGVISMDEHAAGWSSAALTKVPKRNRQSERIATLRERGYSEQELAETQRLDRHNLLLVLLTLASLLLAASAANAGELIAFDAVGAGPVYQRW